MMGLELLKYEHAKYNGTANLKLGLLSRLYRKSKDGHPKLINPIDRQIDLKVF